jgi:hypothetical protein
VLGACVSLGAGVATPVVGVAALVLGVVEPLPEVLLAVFVATFVWLALPELDECEALPGRSPGRATGGGSAATGIAGCASAA